MSDEPLLPPDPRAEPLRRGMGLRIILNAGPDGRPVIDEHLTTEPPETPKARAISKSYVQSVAQEALELAEHARHRGTPDEANMDRLAIAVRHLAQAVFLLAGGTDMQIRGDDKNGTR